MHGSSKYLSTGIWPVFLLAGAMVLSHASGDEPKPFMMSGVDTYWERALTEIKKQKPEMDTSKLRRENLTYSYDPPQQTPWWSESIQVSFADPFTDKVTALGGFQAVSSTHLIVKFSRNPKHEHEPEVQAQSAPYTKMVSGKDGPFSADKAVSLSPTATMAR